MLNQIEMKMQNSNIRMFVQVFATAGTKVTVQDIRISKGFREKVIVVIIIITNIIDIIQMIITNISDMMMMATRWRES